MSADVDRPLSPLRRLHTDSEPTTPMSLMLDRTTLSSDDHAVRSDIDQLHADALDVARRTKQLAAVLDHGDYCAAGGRVRNAAHHIWQATEDLHSAFHTAPPRVAGPHASLSRLCGRRMRYLATRIARGAE